MKRGILEGLVSFNMKKIFIILILLAVISWFVPIIPVNGIVSCGLPNGEVKKFGVTLEVLLFPPQCKVVPTTTSSGAQI